MTDTHLQSQSSCSHTSSNILLCESLATFESEDGALLATAFDSSSIMRAATSRSMKMHPGWRSGVLKSIAFITLATLVPRVLSDTSSSKIGIHPSELFQGNIFRNVDDESIYHRRLQSPSGMPVLITENPTMTKTDKPSKSPTKGPTPGPTPNPSRRPSRHPSTIPTTPPTPAPTRKPTDKPSLHPSRIPTSVPTANPTPKPSVSPSRHPTGEPSSRPSRTPTSKPTTLPSRVPSNHPTFEPSSKPTMKPSDFPTGMPSNLPSISLSLEPSTLPTRRSSTMPSRVPSSRPSTSPSMKPSSVPSVGPTFEPTTIPTVIPTSLPSKEPNFGPSVLPSKYPSEAPTIFPSLYPSAFPSIKASSLPSSTPSKNPTSVPSKTPSVVPSLTPTGLPTLEPSTHPSSRPTVTPTNNPSSNPTFNPSSYPSGHPSSRPSANPSSRPTQVPSLLPSATPTQFPTLVPSVSPTKSSEPSLQPSTTPSVLPSLSPSQGPSFSRQELSFFVLFQFDDLDDVNDKSRAILESETSRVIKIALETEHPEDRFNVISTLKGKSPINGLSSAISTDFNRKLSGDETLLQRRLQTTRSGLEVSLQVFVNTRSSNNYDTETLQNSIGTAFDTVDDRTEFIDSLQQQDTAFSRINSVRVIIDDEEVDLIQPSEIPWIYIGVGTGVAVAAISSFLFIIYRRRRRDRNALEDQVRTDARDVRAPNEFIHVDDGEDQDVSTLGYPDAYGGNAFANPFTEDDQQNESMVSAAYDYKMAYGGAGGDLPSVSSAGGTRSASVPRALADDLTEGGQSRQRVDSEDISRISSAQEELSLFEEDNSFDRMYGEDERIEVIAPPGKLGVVIDTPMNGAPMVHAIKETSVLADRVRIGDRLMSVDGQDTTEMSAIRVSKLISSKAMNAQRRMVFLRPASRN